MPVAAPGRTGRRFGRAERERRADQAPDLQGRSPLAQRSPPASAASRSGATQAGVGVSRTRLRGSTSTAPTRRLARAAAQPHGERRRARRIAWTGGVAVVGPPPRSRCVPAARARMALPASGARRALPDGTLSPRTGRRARRPWRCVSPGRTSPPAQKAGAHAARDAKIAARRLPACRRWQRRAARRPRRRPDGGRGADGAGRDQRNDRALPALFSPASARLRTPIADANPARRAPRPNATNPVPRRRRGAGRGGRPPLPAAATPTAAPTRRAAGAGARERAAALPRSRRRGAPAPTPTIAHHGPCLARSGPGAPTPAPPLAAFRQRRARACRSRSPAPTIVARSLARPRAPGAIRRRRSPRGRSPWPAGATASQRAKPGPRPRAHASAGERRRLPVLGVAAASGVSRAVLPPGGWRRRRLTSGRSACRLHRRRRADERVAAAPCAIRRRRRVGVPASRARDDRRRAGRQREARQSTSGRACQRADDATMPRLAQQAERAGRARPRHAAARSERVARTTTRSAPAASRSPATPDPLAGMTLLPRGRAAAQRGGTRGIREARQHAGGADAAG